MVDPSVVGSGVVLTQLGGYQVVLVWSPGHMRRGQGSDDEMYIITVDTIGLGYKDELVIARKLLVADDEGHPVLGVIKHLRERGLSPLHVQILKVYPDKNMYWF